MIMKFDLHTHSGISPAAEGDISQMIACAKNKGLTGMAITDIERADSGLEAMQDANSNNFLVIPGVEYATEYGILLGLFIERSFKLPEYQRKGSRKWVFEPVVQAIRKNGGIIVLAQPLEGQGVLPQEIRAKIDALEVYNSRNAFLQPEPAEICCYEKLAIEYNLPVTAGSNSYFPEETGGAWLEIDLPDSFNCEDINVKLQIVKDAVLRGDNNYQGTAAKSYFISRSSYLYWKAEKKRGKMLKSWLRMMINKAGKTF